MVAWSVGSVLIQRYTSRHSWHVWMGERAGKRPSKGFGSMRRLGKCVFSPNTPFLLITHACLFREATIHKCTANISHNMWKFQCQFVLHNQSQKSNSFVNFFPFYTCYEISIGLFTIISVLHKLNWTSNVFIGRHYLHMLPGLFGEYIVFCWPPP